jgi:hemerythrin-like domain-containing protein
MHQFPHMCGGMMNPSVSLCEPLAKLKREHTPLREKMNQFAADASNVGHDPQVADWAQKLSDLKTKVVAFIQELDPHSELEEGTLFPLMAKYIGRDVGPIAVMEYEHEQAKQYLKTFVELMESEPAPVCKERARELASYAIRAHSILTDHFMKEENVLFPMAETILNDDDKNELRRKVCN